MKETNTIVIGASAAGLAVAACLKRQGVGFELLEKSDRVGSAWRGHYDRLHLHTHKGGSGLPYLPMPRSYPRYPARDQVVEYLEAYRAHHGLEPRYSQEVAAIERHAEGGWQVRTGSDVYRAHSVVLATGYTHSPQIPRWVGMDDYRGEILHSSRYRNGDPWEGREVLVVGFGNSACEIAIDLHERGASPSMAVRSPVNIVPRDILGIPILSVGVLFKPLPAKLADLLARPLVALTIGDFTKYGLRRLPYGPNTQIRREGRIPLLNIGTVELIKEGRIKVHPGIERFTTKGVVFTDGVEHEFATVVLATGYRPDLTPLGATVAEVADERGVPRVSGREAAPGLFFCGFYVSPSGMLREIGVEAKRIARAIARRKR